MIREWTSANKMTLRLVLLALCLLSLNWGISAVAEESETNEELDNIERELEKSAPRRRSQPQISPSSNEKKKQDVLADLRNLQDFSEVSVIQRKFLPKTNRFQAGVNATWITNDAFFNTYGGGLHLGYFFREFWGVEFEYSMQSSSPAKATKELEAINTIATSSLVSPKSYMGLNVTLVPIYGKTTWLNHRIVPYDFFFNLGYGTTQTQMESVPTYHFGLGQIYGITKSMAFRWDFGWNSFSATGINKAKGNFNTLTLGLGISFFFPGAKYR